jgi:transposase
MGKVYRPYYPDEELLLPPSLRDWLPEKHLAYFVSDVVDNLDLSAMDAVYGNEKRGQPPYDPWMMTKVLVYAYCVGVFSSRRIERRLVEDIAFRVLAAGNQPNFRTISDFRKIHLKTLEGLFEQVLQIALEAGAMKVGRVALDGTKMKANASKHKAMSYDRMGEKQKQLRAEVKQLLEQAEAADAEEDDPVRPGSDRGRVAGGVGTARDATAEDPGSQTRVGGKSAPEGGGRGRRCEASEAPREGPVQLHRSGIAHHERRGWLRAGLQRAGSRRTGLTVDRRPNGDAGHQR